MIQKKIHRLARLLKKFSFDDIAMTLELNGEDEINARKYLSELIKNGDIRKISADKYQFLENKTEKPVKMPRKRPRLTKTSQEFKINPKTIDISKDDNYELYLNSSPSIKKRIDKYLAVIHAAEGLKGNHLELFLEQWNKKYPDMKVSRSSFMRTKKMIIAGGLASLLLNRVTPENNTKKQIYDVIYNYFNGSS